MHRTDLRELVRSGDFISGIYNYCDRWCERCPLTARCLVYATEKADGVADDPEAHDLNSAKFWARLESRFQEAREMIMEWAAEAGVDLEAIDTTSDADQLDEGASEHELSVGARLYAQLVQLWFTQEFAVEQNVHDDITGKRTDTAEDVNVSDAIEVIRWYQFFIAAKLFRALIGLDDEPDDDEPTADLSFDGAETDDYEEPIGGDDSDGSAKIALIAIDRSVSAWRIMQNSLPEKTDSIVPLLIELERMRLIAEQVFPGARDFIRPGFDEVISDFVS